MTGIARLELPPDRLPRRCRASNSDRRAGQRRGADEICCDGVQSWFNSGVCRHGACAPG